MDPSVLPTGVAGDDSCPQCGHEVADAWLVCAWCGHQLAAPAELEVGTRLADDRYQILGVIGRGGFGITYEVGDRRLQRRVAMKELFPESAVRHRLPGAHRPQEPGRVPRRPRRFLRERAAMLARFTHPGIVRVYEVFEEHGTAYLVMELLEGRTLVELLRERNRPFAEDEVLDVAGRVAAALRPVHAAGVLHRDVNPSNVMMTHHGRIVVIDFGLARDYEHGQTVGMTRMVTPGYAPLEQYRGEGRFGPATDVYGLAATCYRLATGRVPVSAIEREGGASIPSPRSVNPEVSKAVSDAILDGLELEPNHRPQDLDSFLARLGRPGLPAGPRSLLLDRVPPAPAGPATHGDPDRWLEASGVPGRPAALVVPPVGGPDRTGPTVVVARQPAGPTLVAPPAADATLPVGSGQAVLDLTAAGPAPAPADRTLHAGAPPAPARPAGSSLPPPSPGAGRLPLAIGPHPPGRRKLTVPLFAVALATASAAPVLITALVVLVALPLVATVGDSAAHRLRAQRGLAAGWAERRLAPGALAPARFLRNVLASVLRASPMIGIGAVLLAGWYGLEGLDAPAGLVNVALRVVGAIVVGVVVATARDGSSRFRSGLGIDALVERWVPHGRTTEAVAVGWVVAVFVVAGSLWLTPAPFPLP
ncbi:MAG: protein kinase [Actinobacteria bacterium]|nr:protein kinase [Actinomycetota bacterium]